MHCIACRALLCVSLGKRANFNLGTVRVRSTKCLSDLQVKSSYKVNEKSPLTSRRKVCQRVLEHFDAQYAEELGSLWMSVRSVLLNPDCWQHGVMLNRFTDLGDLRMRLQELGYTSLLPQSDQERPSAHTLPPPVSAGSLECVVHERPSTHTLPPRVSSGSLECVVQRAPVRLPAPRHERGRLKPYFLLNAASLLPVLALAVTEGDRVMDMCSAPGGKALAILQTTRPGLLHCNEVDKHRCDWLSKTLESYVPAPLMETLQLTNQDGRDFGHTHQGMYDKVLVDAPCSNDRSWLFTSSVQQGELWLKERQKLPKLQAQLLCSALAAVRPGGAVVYSTCTLSRAENHAVVEAALATCPGVEPEDLQEELANQLSEHFSFAPPLWPPGLLVVPERLGHTWGPMYLSRLRRRT
ncbi:tRNA (cytosine(34)-C(5))-methyltransferase, mitochondrial isoform X2 [Clupea harengus]|uniref:tRNA (Cytosine(34)-C(5))-methyltransferase, mitochondrial isoform X2 n=1 Tax=Clupea harengus TaxID=7950 RepID=A0A6P8EP67_CLUHA|nr:tRNA (cytosine(34)-C(5))-methyltransferase, mitochondrial isoform X2 [Clupea harengus]